MSMVIWRFPKSCAPNLSKSLDHDLVSKPMVTGGSWAPTESPFKSLQVTERALHSSVPATFDVVVRAKSASRWRENLGRWPMKQHKIFPIMNHSGWAPKKNVGGKKPMVKNCRDFPAETNEEKESHVLLDLNLGWCDFSGNLWFLNPTCSETT